MDTIRQDLKDMDTSWEEAEELATGRAEWRQRVAQYIHQNAGWTKVRFFTSMLLVARQEGYAVRYPVNKRNPIQQALSFSLANRE